MCSTADDSVRIVISGRLLKELWDCGQASHGQVGCRGDSVTEPVNRIFQSLASLPEVCPQVTFFFQPLVHRCDVQLFGPKPRSQFNG
jgi:hypothetical protein